MRNRFMLPVLALSLLGMTLAGNARAIPVSGDRVTGVIDMVVTRFDAGAFGLADSPGSLQATFSASVVGYPPPVGGQPPDPIYEAMLEGFHLVIGNTHWDETMPYNMDTLVVKIVNGVATGTNLAITDTMPAHPDLLFSLPASPGEWQAIDEVNGVNNGTIGGTYTLRAIPEPGVLALVGLGLGGFGFARRRGKRE